jgi:hypothetical protein
MGTSTTERYVTESNRPSFVTINDQFTVDFAAEDASHLSGDQRSLSFPIVKDGNPVVWYDLPSMEDYARLLEDALKSAAMEIAAMRLLADIETMRADLAASLRFAFGDLYTAYAVRAESVVDVLVDDRDAQTALIAVKAQFGTNVYGQVLLFHVENNTSLKIHAEALTFTRALKRQGMTVADLGWPDESLKPWHRQGY